MDRKNTERREQEREREREMGGKREEVEKLKWN